MGLGGIDNVTYEVDWCFQSEQVRAYQVVSMEFMCVDLYIGIIKVYMM